MDTEYFTRPTQPTEDEPHDPGRGYRAFMNTLEYLDRPDPGETGKAGESSRPKETSDGVAERRDALKAFLTQDLDLLPDYPTIKLAEIFGVTQTTIQTDLKAMREGVGV